MQYHTQTSEPRRGPGALARWARSFWLLVASAMLGLGVAATQAQTVYFHNDGSGSPVAASDESGNLLWRESYRPYGDRMLKPVAANTQWFHGKQLDPDTGMEDFGARNYDPIIGRFLSIDPVDFGDKDIHSFNRYAYGNNNPLRYKDPDGRAPRDPGEAAFGFGFGLAMSPESVALQRQAEMSVGNVRAAIGMDLGVAVKTGDIKGVVVAVAMAKLTSAGSKASPQAANTATAKDKVVYRLGDSPESASRLGRKSAEAESVIGHHGVSVSTTKPPAGTPCSGATCSSLEARGFEVRPTPTRNDPNHHTVVLPNPVTKEVAKDFNDAFGR